MSLEIMVDRVVFLSIPQMNMEEKVPTTNILIINDFFDSISIVWSIEILRFCRTPISPQMFTHLSLDSQDNEKTLEI